MSRELRQASIEHRDQQMVEAFQESEASIADDLVFPGEDGNRSASEL